MCLAIFMLELKQIQIVMEYFRDFYFLTELHF